MTAHTLGAVLIWVALLAPALAGAAVLARPSTGLVDLAEAVGASVVLVAALGLLAVTAAEPVGVATASGLLRADGLSAFLLTVVGAVAVTATWGGRNRVRAASPRGPRYAALVCLFVTAMVLAVLADDLGVTWVAVEATTIATAFLVGHAGGPKAVEAAWKYVVLASVGVAIAFLGLVLLFAAARGAGTATLSWSALAAHPAGLDPTLTRTGLALAALGFATKAGLAPMHSWLPDAHGQAPAPVSGLMSGVLLAVAFGAVLRLQRLDAVLLDGSTISGMLLAGGLASLLVAAALILTQRDYKRLLAYSSIEHMGLAAVAAAIGGRLALTAMMLHLLGHGLAKSATFLTAGGILRVEGSSVIGDVRGLLARQRRLGVLLLLGGGALLGLPPSALFLSEAAIVVAGVQAGHTWAMAAVVVLLLVVFAGFGRHVVTMTLGAVADTATDGAPRRAAPVGASGVPLLPVGLALGVTAVLALAGWPLRGALENAVAVLGGGS